jgi:hypothetical protein
MIDKVEVRVPRETVFSPEYFRVHKHIAKDPGGPFHRTLHYESVADLSPYGFSAIVHLFNKHGEGNHKLELLESGKRTLSESADIIQRVFDLTDAKRDALVNMRIDATADIAGVPVGYFSKHMFVKGKRWTREVGKYGDDLWQRMGSYGIQTVYEGRPPNMIRVYDKPAETRQLYEKRYRRALLEAKKKARGGPIRLDFPDYETEYPYPDGCVVTRVERQMAAGRVPEVLATFGDLRNSLSIHPFEKLQLMEGASEFPKREDYRPDVWRRGLELREVRLEQGCSLMRRWLNKKSKGNASRILRTCGDIVFAQTEEEQEDFNGSITTQDIFDSYCESTARQLEA